MIATVKEILPKQKTTPCMMYLLVKKMKIVEINRYFSILYTYKCYLSDILSSFMNGIWINCQVNSHSFGEIFQKLSGYFKSVRKPRFGNLIISSIPWFSLNILQLFVTPFNWFSLVSLILSIPAKLGGGGVICRQRFCVRALSIQFLPLLPDGTNSSLNSPRNTAEWTACTLPCK